MRAARLGMTLVGTSVADERAFSCMIFLQKQLADASVDQLSPSDRKETELAYMLTSIWGTSQISLQAYVGKLCLPFGGSRWYSVVI
jgi:hypothetical protein